MRREIGVIPLATLILGVVVVSGCSETVDGLTPVGGAEASEVEQRRFLRRLHLDLSGAVPNESDLTANLDTLSSDGDSATTRAGLADGLLSQDKFPIQFVSEIENGVYGGERIEDRYALLCGIIRSNTVACQSCTSSDPCDCTCTELAEIFTDRQGLYDAADDMMAGASTSDIERRYAKSRAFRDLSAADTVSTQLFEQFVGRIPEPDELTNSARMMNGLQLDPSNPTGLLFHRHGSDYDDLIDIIFESEVYREALVKRVFERYLGRLPSADELSHFSPEVDSSNPDLRPIIRAVTSSREYFEQ